MRGKLTGWRDITLQSDCLETEANDIIQTMFLGLDYDTYQRTRDNLTKLVKAAFFAGRDQIIDEAPYGWIFYGPDVEWHWSETPDFHERVKDLRPATAVEAALANKPIEAPDPDWEREERD